MSAHHIAEYNGKRVAIDYVPKAREFRTACQRIIDNGASGMVHCPDGAAYAVKCGERLARLVHSMNRLEHSI